MARKKPMQYVPLDERPEFIEAMAALPTEPAELEAAALKAAHVYHDAMLAGDVQTLDDADLVYQACVCKLNGGTRFGCGDIQRALEVKFAAFAGHVPRWGQAGEFLLEVDGMRLVVVMKPDTLSNHCGAELNAVDFDKPFVSKTGYRHHYMRPVHHLGLTVDQAVRAEVVELLTSEGKAVRITDEGESGKSRTVRPWLADALAGIRPDGQLAMFGDAPKDPDAKVPLSNAERQRRHRLRLKELADTEGLKTIALTRTERMVLSLGVLAHEDLHHRPNDWATSKKPGFDSLLVKLWPEGDDGRYLAEPERSTRRPAAFLRDELERQRGMVERLEHYTRELRAEVEGLKSQNAAEIADRAKAFDAVAVLTARLKAAGLPTDYRKQPGE